MAASLGKMPIDRHVINRIIAGGREVSEETRTLRFQSLC